jgi:hypothetical protein
MNLDDQYNADQAKIDAKRDAMRQLEREIADMEWAAARRAQGVRSIPLVEPAAPAKATSAMSRAEYMAHLKRGADYYANLKGKAR